MPSHAHDLFGRTYDPARGENQYLARGYSAVAFTDHEILYDHSDLTDENFVAINGYELATNNDRSPDPLLRHQSAHFNFIAKDPKTSRRSRITAITTGAIPTRRETKRKRAA